MRASPSMRRTLTRTGVRAGVCARTFAKQVVDDLTQPVAVADHRRGLELRRDRPIRLHELRRLDGLGDDAADVDRLLLERPALVEPRQQQQVVDEQAHPLRLARDPRHRPRQVLGMLGSAAREELGVGAHRRERRAKLVRCIGDEAPQLSLRRLARAKGRLDLAEHRVQRATEPPNLGALVLVAPHAGRGRRPRSWPRSRRLHSADASRLARPTFRAARSRAGPRASRSPRRARVDAACCRRRPARSRPATCSSRLRTRSSWIRTRYRPPPLTAETVKRAVELPVRVGSVSGSFGFPDLPPRSAATETTVVAPCRSCTKSPGAVIARRSGSVWIGVPRPAARRPGRRPGRLHHPSEACGRSRSAPTSSRRRAPRPCASRGTSAARCR